MTGVILALALGAALHASPALRDVNGMVRHPLQPNAGEKATVVFFVTNDCPISNSYAREIRRICEEYGRRSIGCSLVYADGTLSDEAAKAHAKEFGHGAYPWLVDRQHLLVKASGATVTPQAMVFLPGGALAYRGRIDDFWATWGQSRREARKHDLRDALEAVLAGRPAPHPETKAIGCWIQ